MNKKSAKKRKTKTPNKSAEEILLLYQIQNKEEELQEIVFREKLLAEENSIRLNEIKQLTWEQERVLTNAVHADKMSRDEKKVGRLGFALVERVDVMAQLSKNACLQGGCQEAVEGIKRSHAENDEEINKLEGEIKKWESFRDEGMQEMKEKIRMMERTVKEEEERFNFIKEQTERQGRERQEEIVGEMEKQVVCVRRKAALKTVEEMNRMERQTLYDNEWLVKELELQRLNKERLAGLLEMSQADNMQLLLQVKSKHGQSVENLAELQTLFSIYAGLEKDKKDDDDEKKEEDNSKNNNKADEEMRKGGRWPVTGGMLRRKLNIT